MTSRALHGDPRAARRSMVALMRDAMLQVLRGGRALVLSLMLALIVVYQRCLSPFVGAHCRFSPTCSAYAATSLRKHGLIKGLLRSVWRVLRCHPFSRGGHDPP